MHRSLRPIVAGLLLASVNAAPSHAAPDSRLPSLGQSNIFISGQVLGCVVRFEIYTSETGAALLAAGTPVPPQAQDVDVLFGFDVAALRSDLVGHMASQETTLEVPALVGAIEEISLTELAGNQLDQGYVPSWMQVAGYSTLFRQLGLFERYPVNGQPT